MPKMRLGWYAGASTALAGSVVLSAFYQRANFYSAMVYLAQSNFCLIILVNFALLLYSSFVYGLTRIFFGPLRAVEVEQLTERAWFAITETCLAMTIFREEIGAWFLVMFAALVTGKVWGWIGDGRVEVLEQQPPANPRLFHLRLSVSLTLSFVYDIYILRYIINTVIRQARPNMMVMFLFEFAVLATCSWRTAARYALSLTEHNIQEQQKRKRLAERRQEVRDEREAIIRRRQEAAASGEEIADADAPLPDEDDIDEMDIEVPGWSAKGEWVLWLDLVSDLIKLGIYIAFFFMLLTFYGLPIHIMRDLFMTSRDFIKRLNALMRYRRAIQEMNRYPDATEEELSREDTCIICREEMRPWPQENTPGAIDRIRPKKLPCGHILHLGCLKSWLERQQVCPTCRRPVTGEPPRAAPNRGAAGLRIEIGGGARAAVQPPANNGGNDAAQGQNNGAGAGGGAGQAPRQQGGPRIFNLGPIRLGFGANGQQVRELAQQFGIPQAALNPPGQAPAVQPAPTPDANTQTTSPANVVTPQTPMSGDNLQNITNLLQQAEQMIEREMASLQTTQQELFTMQLLAAELHRVRQRQRQPQETGQNSAAPSMAMPSLVQAQPPVHMPPQVPAPMPFGFPTFPSASPRNQNSLMMRHVAPTNATPIGSDSADLPDGVVIPPGWSLLPLQRMDGVPSFSTQPSPQAGPHNAAEESSSIAQPTPTTTTQPLAPSVSNLAADATADDSSPVLQERGRISNELQRANSTERPAVVAPSPRMPNWGGSAQLFRNESGLGSQFDLPVPEPANAVAAGESSTQGALGDEATSAETGTQSSSSSNESPDKGKAKAVTVEDAADEDDDDEEDDEDESEDEQ